MTRITRSLSALIVAGVLAGAGATAVGAPALAGAPGPTGATDVVLVADGPSGPDEAFDWE